MAYQRCYPSRIVWENEPSIETPINENNLNLMDKAIYDIDGRVVEHEQEIDALQNYETRAAQSATASENSAEQSESWAVGDTGKRAGENTNNSKYWSKVSEGWAHGGTSTHADEETDNAKYWSERSKEYADDSEETKQNLELDYIQFKSDLQKDYNDYDADFGSDYARYKQDLSNDKSTYSQSLNAQGKALVKEAESWAHGGTASREGEDSDNAMYYSTLAHTHEVNAATIRDETQEILDSVQDVIDEALEENVPDVVVDLGTGHLLWQGGRFFFQVNESSGHLMWQIA